MDILLVILLKLTLRGQDYSSFVIEEIKKVHYCYYDETYLQVIDIGGLELQRAIGTDVHY